MTTPEDNNKSLTPEQIAELYASKRVVEGKYLAKIKVGRKKYKIRQISKWISRKIHRLELHAYYVSQERKNAITERRAQKIDKDLQTLHAKTAAYYLLGNYALFVPFLYAITWRRLMLRNEEHCARINDNGANNKEVNFSLANWDITRLRLALSMKAVGEGVEQYLQRMESAENMVQQDGSPKSRESTLEHSSKKPPTTKK